LPHNGWLKNYNYAERLLWQNPEAVLAQIGFGTGNVMVDVGCGDGFFSIPAARITGPSGLIHALDSSPEAIEILQTRAKEAGISNIQTTVGDAEEYVFCQHCADFVLMANVLHDFHAPLKALECARSMLKPDGKLVDLDWKKEPDQLHGPPLAKRLNQEEAAALLQQAGFRITMNTLSPPFHYLLLAEITRE
jgi:ubiquinone/menaquinone biosynthesis C-methylase UbiE